MKIFISILVVVLLSPSLLCAQSTFQKIYDYSEFNQSYDIVAMIDSRDGQDFIGSSEGDFQYEDVITLCDTLPEPPVADFSFQNACLGETVLFTDESEGAILNWTWDFDGDGSSVLQDPEFSFAGFGPFSVQLIVDDGCLSDTIIKEVELQGVIFNPFDTTICLDETLLFNGEMYAFSSPSDIGSFSVIDTLSSFQGCDSVVILTLNVTACKCELIFPNVFTPDNDGLNDTFGPIIACDQTINNYRLLIYDRWGENVFDTYEQWKKWDGTLNGYPLPRDVFVYAVQYEIENGGETEFFSEVKDFTLIR